MARAAVYTAIYGGYDLLRAHPEVAGVDFHCFTDDAALVSRRDWIVHLAPSRLPPRLAAKRPKILGPQEPPLDGYDVTLWLDANVDILSTSFAQDALADLGPHGFALYRNPDLDCVYDQVISCIRGLPPEAARALLRQAARYYAEGHPEHDGMWACSMMARRRSPALDRAMRDWWTAVSSWSVGADPPFGLPRDQVDLSPVLRRNGIEPRVWPHSIKESPWWRRQSHGVRLGDALGLRGEIEGLSLDVGGWCSSDKAVELAALVLDERPRVAVEIGAWEGGSAIPIALALRHLGAGTLVVVDAWSVEASVAGQDEVNAAWWRAVGAEGHERARRAFLNHLEKRRLDGYCAVVHQRSEDASVPAVVDLLHWDGNHGPQAVADVDRWARAVRVGGVLVLNDLGWTGGHVRRARDRAVALGFVEFRPLGAGCVMRREKVADL